MLPRVGVPAKLTSELALLENDDAVQEWIYATLETEYIPRIVYFAVHYCFVLHYYLKHELIPSCDFFADLCHSAIFGKVQAPNQDQKIHDVKQMTSRHESL